MSKETWVKYLPEDDNDDARKYNDDVDFEVDWGSRGVIGKITT